MSAWDFPAVRSKHDPGPPLHGTPVIRPRPPYTAQMSAPDYGRTCGWCGGNSGAGGARWMASRPIHSISTCRCLQTSARRFRWKSAGTRLPTSSPASVRFAMRRVRCRSRPIRPARSITRSTTMRVTARSSCSIVATRSPSRPAGGSPRRAGTDRHEHGSGAATGVRGGPERDVHQVSRMSRAERVDLLERDADRADLSHGAGIVWRAWRAPL